MPKEHKDLCELRKFSDKNMQFLRDAVGETALAALPGIMARHADLFQLNCYHETHRDNIPAIAADGKVLSYDRIQKNRKKVTAGMTVAERTVSSIFSNVAHIADSYTDFVYMRPVFGSAKGGGTGILWRNRPLREDMWFSFVDPNQPTDDDKLFIEMGMGITKSFDSHDVYVGGDIAKAVALKALVLMAEVAHIGKLSKFKYDRMVEEHAKNPYSSEPSEKENMTFESVMELYSGICMSTGFSREAQRNAEWRHGEEALSAAGLAPGIGKLPQLSAEEVGHPRFDEYFRSYCDAVTKKAALLGQIAVPREISLKGAEIFLNGQSFNKSPSPSPR